MLLPEFSAFWTCIGGILILDTTKRKMMNKGNRGVRVKKSMLGSFERSPLGGTDAFYRISKLICVQKLSHFEVGDFSRISYKKTDKIDILRYFTPNVSAPSIFVQMSWNLHQMTTPYRGTKLRRLFWKFWKLVILCQFCTNNGLKCLN